MSSGSRQQDGSGKCERRNLHGCFFVCLIESLELNDDAKKRKEKE
jgi:hypothetical protein